MITLVSPTFLKQESKKLRKSLGISHHKALDEISKKYGFFNYRHFLHVFEKFKVSKDADFGKAPLQTNTSQKICIEIPKFDNHEMSFDEQLDTLKFFQEQEHVQAMCDKWGLMKEEIQTALFNEFLAEEGDDEIHFRHPYYIAKHVSLNEFMYEINDDILCVDGNYDLIIKLNCDEEITDPLFQDRLLSGSFGIEIARDKTITIPHLSVVEIIDGTVYASTIRPNVRHLPAYKLG